jgi:hypothetical protein
MAAVRGGGVGLTTNLGLATVNQQPKSHASTIARLKSNIEIYPQTMPTNFALIA